MIRNKKLKDMLLTCDQDWIIRLSKWEHLTDKIAKQRGYPFHNRISLKINDISSTYRDEGGRIFKFILEDSNDNLELPRDEMINILCKGEGQDYIELVLEVESYLGHFDYIPLHLELGDFDYKSKIMNLEFIETQW